MIYLDYSATTPVDPEVAEAMAPYLAEAYGNPSSKYYPAAQRARQAVEQSRERVAALIGARPEEIIFTAGATESTNTVIKGVADYKRYYENKGNHIITSVAEHKATINTCRFLNGEIYSNSDATFSLGGGIRKVDRGYRVTFLEVDSFGRVSGERLEEALQPETALVSLIWVNNETGSLNDIPGLTRLCHERGVPLHADATQALGKVDVDVSATPVDYMSFSAHKIYGPKGVGGLYVRGDDYGLPPFTSLLHGGEQENGVRAGTLAVHNIVGFGKAAELALRDRKKNREHLDRLDGLLITGLEKIPGVELLMDLAPRAPGIVSFVINRSQFNNELFLRKVSPALAMSSGSACSAGEPSHVLKAMGREQDTGRVVRVSLGKYTTEEDILFALVKLGECI